MNSLSSPTLQRFSLALLLLGLLGCSAGSGEGLDTNGRPVDENPDAGTPVVAGSYKQIQDEIFTPLCIICHSGAAAPVGLKLDTANSYNELVSVASVEVPSLLRVAPGNPDDSYLVQKLDGSAAVGDRMPLGGAPVPTHLIAVVRDWIADGALPDDASDTEPMAPVIVTTVPQQDTRLMSSPDNVVVVFDQAMDFSLLSDTTVTLVEIGIDAEPGTSDDQLLIPSALTATNPQTLTIDLAGQILAPGNYQLTLKGDGATVLTSLQGIALDGNRDSTAGGDFVLNFTLLEPITQTDATWRWIQDNIFTPVCVQCHIDNGIAAFLKLDELNSYSMLFEQPSNQVNSLLLVNPGDAGNSYLIQKVEGTATEGARMPLGGDPLPADVIQAMRDWIDNGAMLEDTDLIPDVLAPSISLVVPTGEVAGLVTISASAVDDVAIAAVRFFVDEILQGTVDTMPYDFELDTTTLTDGAHDVWAEAEDTAGNIGQSSIRSLQINNSPVLDVDAPSVAVDSTMDPAAGTIVISVSATDNVGIAQVELFVNGVSIGVDDALPYEFSIDTTTLGNGSHALNAQATDTAGNIGNSTVITINVDNGPEPDVEAPFVSINPLPDPATATTTVIVSASDNVAVTQVELFIDGTSFGTATIEPFSFSVDTTMLSDGAHTLTAQAVDASGNIGNSAAAVLNVDNAEPPDLEAPSVSINPVADPATGAITVSISAEDNVGVVLVELFVNGVSAGTVSIPPYAFELDTTTLSDGAHNLAAEASDAAGNVGVSTTITLNVDNAPPPDIEAPIVSINMPGELSGNSASVSVIATDNAAVTGVDLYVDNDLITTLSSPPYEFTFDVTTLADGTHVLGASAVDDSGNVGVATPITVIVANGTPQATLPWIQENIFTPSCVNSGCHSEGAFADFLWLTEGDSFSQLVNVPTTNGGADVRVIPGNADNSDLQLRLDGSGSEPSMPFGTALLPLDQRNAVRDWINGGAFESPPDVIAPAIALELPQSPAAGVVTIAATAVDDRAVTLVRFFVDSVAIGTDTVAPFETTFDTSAVADGTRIITAQAEDDAGNIGNAIELLLEVSNN